VATWASPGAFQKAIAQSDFPGARQPFPARPALYRFVREDEPTGDTANTVILINPFEVPAGEDETFLSGWEATRDFLRAQSGYVGAVYMSVCRPTPTSAVNIGMYESPQSFQATVQNPEFRKVSTQIPYRPHPSL
jgi:heme oxygenase (mycobilin-producing)